MRQLVIELGGVLVDINGGLSLRQDIAGIDSAIKEVEAAFGAAQQAIHNAQAQAQANPGAGQPNPGPQPGNGDGVTDVDFEEVK